MRSLIWIFSLIIVVIPAFIVVIPAPLEAMDNSVAGKGNLMILDVSEHEIDRELLFNHFQVLADLGPILLVQPSESDDCLLQKWDIPAEPLSLPAEDEQLYCVSLRGMPQAELAQVARILHQCEDIALVAASKGAEARLAHPVPHFGLEKGYRALRLNRIRPVGPFTAPPILALGRGTTDVKIQSMVSQVSATHLQNTVQDLENMGERKAGSGAHNAETYLVNAFNAINGLNVSIHDFDPYYSANVIAELPGTVDPSVIYVLGGHYDSTSYTAAAPGADDNGSGTAGVLEIARILSQYEFKYTIRFVAFAAEEVGLKGSENYCDKLVDDGDQVAAMINLDMTAYRDPADPYDVDFVTNYSSSALIDFCTGAIRDYVPTLGINEGTLSAGTSDHQSFTEHGFPACFPFEDLDHYSPYIHSPNDLVGISANDFTLARMITQGVLASLATLASPVDLEILHTRMPDTEQASGPYPVTAEVASLISTNVTLVTLHFDLGQGWTSKQMKPTATGSTYISSIPGRADAGYVSYYIEALDDQGNLERHPEGLGSQNNTFFVGYHDDAFADDFEISDNGWTQGGNGLGEWMRDMPTGMGGFDPSEAWTGAKVWGNDLGLSGADGNYKPFVDAYLESPSIDCTGRTGLFLRYRRWLTVEEGLYDQARILVNGHEVFANPSKGNLEDKDWVWHEIDISARADNNPDVRIRFTLKTDGGVQMGGWNLDNLHVGTVSDGLVMPLSLSEVYVSAAAGGSISFALEGTPALASRDYAILMSASGTSPGTPIPPITLPLNWDAVTDLVAWQPGIPAFENFRGNLDGNGQGSAAIHFPVITDPGLLGVTLSVAWITAYPIDFASNPVDLLIAP